MIQIQFGFDKSLSECRCQYNDSSKTAGAQPAKTISAYTVVRNVPREVIKTKFVFKYVHLEMFNQNVTLIYDMFLKMGTRLRSI